MSTILTSTGITFPDSTTQSTAANTPFVACRATLPYASPGLQLTFDGTPGVYPAFQTVPINTQDANYPNYTAFDTTNHWFVAPNAGMYYVSCGIYVNAGGSGYGISHLRTALAVNGNIAVQENTATGQPSGNFYVNQGDQNWRKTAGSLFPQ